jgi:ATP synthase F1, delta subunit
MITKLSRRKIATVVAERLLEGDKTIIKDLAGYLFYTKQTRSINLLVRDIENALLDKGVLVAKVVSVHDLADSVKKQIDAFLLDESGANSVQVQYSIDKDLIGGIQISTPQAILDTSIKNKLQRLKAAKQ